MVEAGVVGVSHCADQVPVLSRQQVRRVVRLQGAQPEMNSCGAEDLRVLHSASLEAQERRVTLRAHLLDLEARIEAVRWRHLIDDRICFDAATSERSLCEAVDLRSDPRMVASQLQPVPEMAGKEGDGLSVVDRQKAHGRKAMRERDLLRPGVGDPVVGEANVQVGRYPLDSLGHQLMADVLTTLVRVHDEAPELADEVCVGANVDHHRGRCNDALAGLVGYEARLSCRCTSSSGGTRQRRTRDGSSGRRSRGGTAAELQARPLREQSESSRSWGRLRPSHALHMQESVHFQALRASRGERHRLSLAAGPFAWRRALGDGKPVHREGHPDVNQHPSPNGPGAHC